LLAHSLLCKAASIRLRGRPSTVPTALGPRVRTAEWLSRSADAAGAFPSLPLAKPQTCPPDYEICNGAVTTRLLDTAERRVAALDRDTLCPRGATSLATRVDRFRSCAMHPALSLRPARPGVPHGAPVGPPAAAWRGHVSSVSSSRHPRSRRARRAAASDSASVPGGVPDVKAPGWPLGFLHAIGRQLSQRGGAASNATAAATATAAAAATAAVVASPTQPQPQQAAGASARPSAPQQRSRAPPPPPSPAPACPIECLPLPSTPLEVVRALAPQPLASAASSLSVALRSRAPERDAGRALRVLRGTMTEQVRSLGPVREWDVVQWRRARAWFHPRSGPAAL
jgi:hypothetical protein